MTRLADWDRRFHAWHAEWLHRAHVWGQSDCGCMVAANVMAITGGADPMADLRGQYDSAESCARLLRDRGFASPADYLASLFPAHAAPALARRGDVGVVDSLKHGPLVVVMGHTVVGIGPTGLVSLPRGQMTRAFAVG